MAAVPSIGRASLVEASARAPQAAAIEGLYERHAAKILGYCLHQLGSREEAEDAVQTTFMNAFRALGRGVVPESESAWLFKIAENVCLSRRRSSWRRGRIESPSDFDVIEEIIPGPSRQRDELIGIEDALASMPEQQRRAILLREWQGLSYREIAEELEVSQSAVETLIFRARRSLAQGLEQPQEKKPKRKSFRRALHVLDVGSIIAGAKTLLAGSAAVKATAAAVALTAAAGTAVSVTPKLEGHSPAPAAAIAASAEAPTPRPVAAPEPRAAERTSRALPAAVTPLQKALKTKVAEAKAKVAKVAPPRVERKAAPVRAERAASVVAPKSKQRPAAERPEKPSREPRPAPKRQKPTRATAPAAVSTPEAAPAGRERAPKDRGNGKLERALTAAPVEVTLPEPVPAALEAVKGPGHK